jgi:hypothetical protein
MIASLFWLWTTITIQSVVEEIPGEGGFQSAVASTGEETLTLLSANKCCLLVIRKRPDKGMGCGQACSRDQPVTTGHLH